MNIFNTALLTTAWRVFFALSVFFILLTTSAPSLAEQPGDAFTTLDVIQANDLDTFRGREGHSSVSVQNNQDLEASISGSSFSADTITSGSVNIAERALDNFSGIGMFNIVTGNNNAVDAAVGVNFNLQ